MKILAIDTSTPFLALGIYDEGRSYGIHLETGRKLSSLLTVMIQRALDASGLKPQEIDYFACGLGPGSFTGMRTGVAAIKGLAWALKKPVIGLSTFDTLARAVISDGRPVVVIVDAKRSLIYSGFYKNRNNCLKRIKPFMLLNEKDLLKRIPSGSILLGDALNLDSETLVKNIKGVTLLDKEHWAPKAQHLLALVLEKVEEKKFSSPFDLEPIYLYPKECQIRTCVITGPRGHK